MQGLMQEFPLRVSTILDHAAKFHGEQQIVSVNVEGDTTVSSYGELRRRAQLCAIALRRLGARYVPVWWWGGGAWWLWVPSATHCCAAGAALCVIQTGCCWVQAGRPCGHTSVEYHPSPGVMVGSAALLPLRLLCVAALPPMPAALAPQFVGTLGPPATSLACPALKVEWLDTCSMLAPKIFLAASPMLPPACYPLHARPKSVVSPPSMQVRNYGHWWGVPHPQPPAV